jgi:hypothetical protein
MDHAVDLVGMHINHSRRTDLILLKIDFYINRSLLQDMKSMALIAVGILKIVFPETDSGNGYTLPRIMIH